MVTGLEQTTRVCSKAATRRQRREDGGQSVLAGAVCSRAWLRSVTAPLADDLTVQTVQGATKSKSS
jgi:hypothetical protein